MIEVNYEVLSIELCTIYINELCIDPAHVQPCNCWGLGSRRVFWDVNESIEDTHYWRMLPDIKIHFQGINRFMNVNKAESIEFKDCHGILIMKVIAGNK